MGELRHGHRRTAVLAGLLLALCACSLVAAVGAKAAPARPLVTGISNVYSNEAAAFDHVRATGSTTVLSPLRWSVIAPAQQPAGWNPEDPADPHYEWRFFDDWVTRAVQAGLTPIFDVRGAPPWAERCRRVSGEAVCNPDPAALAAFTRAAVRRYSGNFRGLPHVRYWQGLNEPNLSLFFEPQYEGDALVSPDLYRTLLDAFYGAVKSVDPSNLVIAAGLGPIAVPRFTIGPMTFARKLLCMTGTNERPRPASPGCVVNFDIFDIHPYTTGGPTHEGGHNNVEMGDVWKLQTLLAAADKAGHINSAFKRTPLWITEMGWDSNPPDPGGLPMKIEKQWIAESLYESWRWGVSNFMWYSLDDFPPEPKLPFSETLQTGLYFYAPKQAEEQPKEVMPAFRFPFVAIRQGKGLKIWGRTPTSQGGRVKVQALRGGKWRKLAVAKADRFGVFQAFVKTGYGEGRKGSVRAVFGGEPSVGFPMRRVGDFRHAPFG
ncbi:MAG TPA: hypothetical protein VFP21_02010 [Solirubrobacterales bacterium]|nr:hypothetical protein [Solirubrobacterales bacterium]